MRYVRAANTRDQRTLPASDLWAYKAACAGMPLELFFGPPGERQPAKSLREADALSICQGCPVRPACQEDALAHEPRNQHGVSGGMTAEERIAERRNRHRRAARGAA